jgi:predicted alpha-1,2-mannosidase
MLQNMPYLSHLKGMQRRTFYKIFVLFAVFASSFAKAQTKKSPLPYVNPFIGTGGHGHTFPGACYPFGMMQLSPDTRLTGWDGCSGYHYSDNIIYGFTHTHLSGTGCSDYGDILLMPVADEPYKTGKKGTFIDSYSSPFIHFDEKASPGYYSVLLKNGNIKAELTVRQRAGIHRYIFSKDDSCMVVLDLKHRDEVLSSRLTIVSDTEICGWRESRAWARDQWVYFDIRFSKPVTSLSLFNDDALISDSIKAYSSKNIKAVFHFKYSDTLLVRIGISAVSEDNAKLNLVSDIPHWDFDGTLKKTQAAWNDYLGKIEVSSKNDSLLTTFYTALYHTAIHPSLYTDANGEYRGMDNKTHTAKNFNVYTVFSIWDTYRALNPLYTIICPSMDKQFIQTFLKQAEQAKRLPVWELSANETNCMIGYHTASIIYDAFQKKIWGYDEYEALDAMGHSAMVPEEGTQAMLKYGYVPSDKDAESVSKTLEYAYDDWCIAMMAKSLGRMTAYYGYIQMAQGYKNVFDPNSGFMRARSNGGWYVPFDPFEVNSNYTEANAWQYSYYVPQDVSWLIKLHGGKEKMALQLDSVFHALPSTTGRVQADISGMIGQYAQGNEPSHHMAYLFNYLGMPWKTTDYVRTIEKLYTAAPDGLCGNEDCGQMSAWYVMSAIGMYQVCPGNPQISLTSPLFDTVKLHFENGKTFTITEYKEIPGATYITSSARNYRNYQKSYILYDSLMKGGTLNYVLSKNPSNNWGMGKDAPADSIAPSENILPSPYVTDGSVIFKDSLLVELKSYSPADKIYYTLNDSTPNNKSDLYNHSFYIHSTCNLKAIAYNGSIHSYVNATTYTRIPKGRSVKVTYEPNAQYTAGGPDALIDYQHGTTNFRLGKWQGYQGTNFEAVVDLGKEENIKTIKAEFLQDEGSWIMMPAYVEFSVSTDGRNFTKIGRVDNELADTVDAPTIKIFRKDFAQKKIRFVKVFAKNYGKLPDWHPGAGGDAYIFIDEITVK